MLPRNIYITCVVAFATSSHIAIQTTEHAITDGTRVSSGYIEQVVTPGSIAELQSIIANIQGPVSIAGAGYSQGGQTWINGGTVIDLKRLTRIVDIDIDGKTITVEAGTPWRHIQEALNPIGLSPKVMQSYNDFSVGGSLSVNAHGRDITGTLIKSVNSIRVLLADGSIVTANRSENYDLFCSVIGGYSACGIIVEATLALTDNVPMQKKLTTMDISEYVSYLQKHIIGNDNVVLHNANLYPKAFTKLCAIDWMYDESASPEAQRTTQLIRPDSQHIVDTFGELLVRRLWGGKYLRQKLESAITSSNDTSHRNYELGRPVATLGPWTQLFSSNILQEYFIPLDHLETFIDQLRSIRESYDLNVLNVSLRYVHADTESLLTYAPHDCCSVVLYINVIRSPWVFESAQKWTQELIDAALACCGTYYLPYHLFASVDQFQEAYPQWWKLYEQKSHYDPEWKLSNSLIERYMTTTACAA